MSKEAIKDFASLSYVKHWIPLQKLLWVPSLHVWSVILSWQLDQTRCDTCLMIFLHGLWFVSNWHLLCCFSLHRCVCNIDCSHISFNPVCASDGRSYDNPCQVKEASCQRQERIEVKFLGHCQGKKTILKSFMIALYNIVISYIVTCCVLPLNLHLYKTTWENSCKDEYYKSLLHNQVHS